MNLNIKKLWVEALRSGEYTQGAGYLRSLRNGVECHCCLGVLCDIVDPQGWKNVPDATIYLHGDRAGGLSVEVKGRTGVSFWDEDHLIRMNDREGYSFDQIAQHIEENL